MHFTLEDILSNFDDKTFARGAEYARGDCVERIRPDGDRLVASVRGSQNRIYQQDIMLLATGRGADFEGECSCPVGFNCKHVVSVLLAYLSQQKAVAASPARPVPGMAQSGLPHPVVAWLQRLQRVVHGAAPLALPPAVAATDGVAVAAKVAFRLLYVLAPDHAGRHIALSLCKARLRVNGEVASATPVNEIQHLLSNPPGYVLSEDEFTIRLFIAMRTGDVNYGTGATEPKGKVGAQLLRMLVDQQQLLWANSWADMAKGQVFPLQAAPRRHAMLAWREEGASLRLGWQFQPQPGHEAANGSIDHIMPTDPPWYIENLSCGELNLQQPGSKLTARQLQELVAQAPLLPAKDKITVSHMLLAQGLSQVIPMPELLEETVCRNIAPQPVLLLGSLACAPAHEYGRMGPQSEPFARRDVAMLAFDYDGERVASDPALLVLRQGVNGIERIERDAVLEETARHTLSALGFVAPEKDQPALQEHAGALILPQQADWLRVTREDLPRLAEQGWRIEKLPEYRYDLSDVEDWYADVDDNADEPGSAWFKLELGIVVNQQRVSLLPVLVDLIRSAPHEFNPQALARHGDSDPLLVALPGGARVALPWGRIKPILGTLGELYFSDKIGGSVRLSRLDAARLAELAAGAQLRWMGGERLRQMGQKLSEFGGVQAVAKPQGLQATLRDYQSEGLAWMQFLREYDLAGILADDMGLGKTIQTLAHILTEKEAGRLDHPALVVAPTSLMSNWQDEAARFAPGLRVLVLQGKDRLPCFDQIDQHDLVLTTYALLPRDEEKLREHEYHLLILDESHYIKNSHSKAAQAAGLLRARHRLCLTGTPLENHLGELWSQFHFLLPGLLGSEKTFNSDFRHPIEKQGNDLRRALLNRRIRPFLLRRTKDKVARELPPKTDMVRNVELSGAQRDLYETVRLAMDKKVRSEIARKGVARSQIVILEALLKLRQVCCDPRLVKNSKAATATRKSAPPSAKLVELMQMIEELLQENRKILVFSQFTSMLALIEAELEARNIDYALLTGDTIDRAAAVRAFQQGQVPIFLISLKAGGVGLNLTAADTVIHYDPWWNPAAENQATDRAWRIGQDKPVFVYKLIAKGTLEEKIQELQHKKSELAQSILSDGEAQSVRISPEDLQMIFAPLEL